MAYEPRHEGGLFVNRCTGIPCNIRRRIIGRVTKIPTYPSLQRKQLLIADKDGGAPSRFACTAYLSDSEKTSRLPNWLTAPSITNIPSEELAQLHDGDILQIDVNGLVSRLWDAESHDNVIFVTNTCNCRCIMCPQPPSPDSEDLLPINRQILSLVEPEKVSRVAFTGGEPTIKLDGLLQLLFMCRKRIPKATIFLLTNGRRLQDMAIANRIVEAHPRITFCIPLFSDIDTIHDEIVGVKGAFAETIQALHNLALLKQRIELRNVMQKRNIKRLPQYAEYIYRNLPFVLHIAFMGMETTGIAHKNIDAVWVEPVQYMDSLKQAIIHLYQRDMEVSIYNLPLCLIPQSLWKFADDSISDWKKTFLQICAICSKKPQCPGLFSTSQVLSTGIAPIL